MHMAMQGREAATDTRCSMDPNIREATGLVKGVA
jgi:hypothetical protein